VPTNPLFLPFLILEVESIYYVPNLHCSSLLLPALFLDSIHGDPNFEMLVVLVLLIAHCTSLLLPALFLDSIHGDPNFEMPVVLVLLKAHCMREVLTMYVV
jgi:hypothetical protein